MRDSLHALSLSVALVTGGTQAVEGAELGARAGYYTEAEEPFVGAELLMRVADSVYFNPNAEYVLTDGYEYFTANADVHYDFPRHGSTYFWLGAGLGLVFVDPDGPARRQSDAAANFIAGIGLSRGPLVPYFQAKIIAKEDSEFVVAVGLRF